MKVKFQLLRNQLKELSFELNISLNICFHLSVRFFVDLRTEQERIWISFIPDLRCEFLENFCPICKINVLPPYAQFWSF